MTDGYICLMGGVTRAGLMTRMSSIR